MLAYLGIQLITTTLLNLGFPIIRYFVIFLNDNEMEHDYFNDQVEITNLDVSYQEKYYDCCPDEAYPSLTVDLEFNQKMKYKDGELLGVAAE